MTFTIDLTVEEARRVQAARKKGFDVTALLHGVIASLPDMPETEAREDKTLALLAQWRDEDATDDPDELNRRDSDTKQLLSDLDANRLALPIPEI